MTRLLSRAFWVVALAGVTLALAACAAQTPERETGATTVPGTESGAAQIGQPVTVSWRGRDTGRHPSPRPENAGTRDDREYEHCYPADNHGHNASRRGCLHPHSRAYLTA